LPPGLRSYHLASSGGQVAGRRVKAPRHFILFRQAADGAPGSIPAGDVGGIDNLNIGAAPEIRSVEGEDGRQAVHLHRGDKPRIMRGLAANLIAADQDSQTG